jgi:cytochrome c
MKQLTLIRIPFARGTSIVIVQSGRLQRGLTVAKASCSQCRAIGSADESPIPEALPFHTPYTRYPVEGPAERFAWGVKTGRLSMPQFELVPVQITDLLASMNSIQGS